MRPVVQTAGRRTTDESPRPPAALALLAMLGAAALALHELFPLPYPEVHRGVAVLVALLSFGTAGGLLAWWHGQRRRQRAAQRALDRERDLQAQALASLHDAVVITDPAFRIRAWNRAAERMYGYSAGEVLGRPLDEVLVSQVVGGGDTAELMDRVGREGLVQADARRRRKDGSWVEVRLQVTRSPGPDGEVQAYIGVHRDITEERRHDDAMRAAQAQIELLTSRAPAGIFQYDDAERLVYLNEMLCALTGLPPERLLADGWLPAVLPADQRRVVASWRAAMEADEPFRDEFRIGLDGSPAWVHAVAMPLRDDEGRRTGVVGVMTDVTETRRLEEQLGKAQRMASLGTLAAGMAHEVNNPLAAVRSGLAFAAGEVAGRPELADAAEALADAAAGADRVARIVRELQAFAEARDQAGSLDVGAVAREAWEALPAPLRERGRLQVEDFAAPRATASRRQLLRVLGHLLQNAFQALPAGGGCVRVRVRAGDGGRTAVEVVDDGPGIPAEQLPRVFDPFYTTREVGQGTGLGLAVCHALVHAMGGAIELDSERGRGTTARLLLPPDAGPMPGEEDGDGEAAVPEPPPQRVAASF